MNTSKVNGLLDSALNGIKKVFRDKLVKYYIELKANCSGQKYDPAGLAVGKFCEAVIRHLQDRIHGNYIPFGTPIANYADEVRRLVMAPTTNGCESERIVIPRALLYMYTMRNKRGIGHVGGDVDANAVDISMMARSADWVICELLRIHHGLSLEEAQDLVDCLAIRELPSVWEVAGKKRILLDGLKHKDQVLLLLYSTAESLVFVDDLQSWTEYSNPSKFKTTILQVLHNDRFIEFNKETESVCISPKGSKYVEENIIVK